MTKTKKITAFILALAVIVTMLPVQASAAPAPQISPEAEELIAGTSITIKPRGTYKKVSYKSSNKKVATVSKKGVVRALKKGEADITVTFTLKNKKTVTRTCAVFVSSTNRILKLEEADDASVQEAMGALESGKAFDILVKGDKASAAETVESLKKKVGYANEYSVLFFYDEILSCNEGQVFRVTKDNCEMYNLSLSFYKKIVAQAMTFCVDDKEVAYMCSFDTYEAYAAAEGDSADDLQDWLFAKNKFCDLSQAMQVWVVSRSCYFNGGGKVLHEAGLMGIVYGGYNGGAGNLWGKTPLAQMRLMEADKAKDTCGGIAKAEVTALTQIGIECLYESDGGHAWTMVYPYNSDGQRLTYEFDYTLRWLEDSHPGDDPNIKTSANRLAICSSKSLIY